MTSSPFVWAFICWGNKGKILFNSQSRVDNRFLSFSLFEGDFLFKEDLCSSPEILNGFQG